MGDHWTAWDPPEVGPEAYIIQKGDTLWDLAGKWFGDPFLWPQVWDENRYILDSHWIYPGDPLVVPGQPTVVPDGGPPEVEDAPPVAVVVPPDIEPEPDPVPEPTLLVPAPLATGGDTERVALFRLHHDRPARWTELNIAGPGNPSGPRSGRATWSSSIRDATTGIRAGDTLRVLRWTDDVSSIPRRRNRSGRSCVAWAESPGAAGPRKQLDRDHRAVL